jgi:protein NrfD
MLEVTTTRNNHLIDPSLLVWGWEIPIYLFLGGMVAGMMIISGYFLFMGRNRESKCSCLFLPYLSIILLSLGMFALFLDLEHKLYVWRLYTTFKITSPMSWGSWILILVYPLLLSNIMMNLPEGLAKKVPVLKKISEFILLRQVLIKNIGLMNIIFGILLGMYTGVLLSSLGARPLWSTSLLWVLFLTSGLSGSAAFVHLIAKDKYERVLLAKGDNIFLAFELLVIIMMLISLLSTSNVHNEAAMILINGSYAASFWVFVIGIGIVIPLIIQLLAVNHKIAHTPIAPILVIAGGLALRFVIVYAGQLSKWF